MDDGYRVFIDADAAPRDVVQTTEQEGRRFHIPVWTVSSINHERDGENHITVDAHPQAADMEILRRVKSGDLVVTQDYGLAALALGKGTYALSPNGMEYTNDNIDRLLFERAVAAAQRQATGRSRGPKKRSDEDKHRFCASLKVILNKMTLSQRS